MAYGRAFPSHYKVLCGVLDGGRPDIETKSVWHAGRMHKRELKGLWLRRCGQASAHQLTCHASTRDVLRRTEIGGCLCGGMSFGITSCAAS